MKSNRLLLSGLVLAALLALAYAFWPKQNKPVFLGPDGKPVVASGGDTDTEVIGGVRRPGEDLRSVARDRDDFGDDEPSRSDSESGYGLSPLIDPNANPQVAAVVKAAKEGGRPELLSPVMASKPFDLATYKKDPQAWLDSPEPGRVFQPAQPSPETPVLRRRSDYRLPVVQGEVVRLSVHATADAPVTFTSFDLGQFSNRLTTITVAADERGVASAEFLATPGTINRVNILAASPMTSGQVKFVVDVSLPQ